MGYLNNVLKSIFRGTVANDDTGTDARAAGKIVNDNIQAIDNALAEINNASEKSANKATNFDAPSHDQYPSVQAVEDRVGGIEAGAAVSVDQKLTAYQQKSEKGQPGGYPGLDANSKVPAVNTYAAMDEIIEGQYIDATTFNDTQGNPVTPGAAKLYQDNTTGNPESGKQYRWSGSMFSPIPSSPGTTDEVVEGVTNLYYTAARVRSTILTGIDVVVSGVISGADTVLSAFGKLQGQINGLTNSLAGKLDKAGYTGTAQDLYNFANTKETPTGAQSKADSALQAAKDYYDGLDSDVTSEEIEAALGHPVANDSEVVKTIETSGGQVLSMDANGKVILPDFSTDGGAEVHAEVTYTWSTGQSQIFTVADSAKTTDVYVNGDRLIKGAGEEWNVNTATGVEILVPLADGDKLAIVSSATAVQSGGLTPQQEQDLADSKTDVISYALSSPSADLAAGDTDSFIAPYNFTLNNYFAGVAEAPDGSALVVGLKKNGTSVTSSNAIIDSGETTSLTGTAPTITTNTFLKGDLITPVISQVGTLTTGKSLKIYLEITKS